MEWEKVTNRKTNATQCQPKYENKNVLIKVENRVVITEAGKCMEEKDAKNG